MVGGSGNHSHRNRHREMAKNEAPQDTPLSTSSLLLLQRFNDRMRRSSTHEHIGAVIELVDAIHDNPFPAFVNAVLLRLASVFHNGQQNTLRLEIVRVLRESKLEFSLITTRDEIFNKVIRISSSNDDNARALLLHFFAALAPAMCHNQKLHHLIIESLDVDTNIELLGAIEAVEKFCVHSIDFASLVVDKICDMLLDKEQYSSSVRKRLIRVLCIFHGEYKTVLKAYNLATKLISETSDRYALAALISATTRLTLKSRFTVSEQLNLLLGEMEKCKGNQNYLALLLTNMKVLSELSHYWTPQHLTMFMDLFEKYQPQNTNRVISLWIENFEKLSELCAVPLLNQINDSIMSWSPYMSSECHDIQLGMMGLAENIVLRIPDNSGHLVYLLSSSFQPLFASTTLTKLQYRRLFKVFKAYLSSLIVEPDNVSVVVQQLANSLIATRNLSFVIEALRTACNVHHHLQKELKTWVDGWIRNTELPSNCLCQLAELQFCCATQNDNVDVDVLINRTPQPNDWELFKIARSAMENGLWKSVALPALNKMHREVLGYETALWIDILRDIAEVQIVTGSLHDLQNFCEAMLRTERNLKILISIPKRSAIFNFPLRFVNALYDLAMCARSLTSVLQMQGFEASVAVPQLFKLNFESRINECIPAITECQQTWKNLYEFMFDADPETLEYVFLLRIVCTMFERIVWTFTRENAEAFMDFDIPDIVVPSVRNQDLDSTLGMVQQRLKLLSQLPLQSRISVENLSEGAQILTKMTSHRLLLPRFFFQQKYRTEIKLHIYPEPQENQTSVVPTSKRFPVTVEGYISSNNKSQIEKITVVASTHFDREKYNYVKENTLETQEGRYFKTTFLMDIYSSGKILFNVIFTDKQSKRIWRSDCSAQMNISYSL